MPSRRRSTPSATPAHSGIPGSAWIRRSSSAGSAAPRLRRAAGLRRAVISKQQSFRDEAELGRDRTRQQCAMIDTALGASTRAGRDPRDDIDRHRRAGATLGKSRTQPTHREPLVAVRARLLAAEHHRRLGRHAGAAALLDRLKRLPGRLPATVKARCALLTDLLSGLRPAEAVKKQVAATGLGAMTIGLLKRRALARRAAARAQAQERELGDHAVRLRPLLREAKPE